MLPRLWESIRRASNLNFQVAQFWAFCIALRCVIRTTRSEWHCGGAEKNANNWTYFHLISERTQQPSCKTFRNARACDRCLQRIASDSRFSFVLVHRVRSVVANVTRQTCDSLQRCVGYIQACIDLPYKRRLMQLNLHEHTSCRRIVSIEESSSGNDIRPIFHVFSTVGCMKFTYCSTHSKTDLRILICIPRASSE